MGTGYFLFFGTGNGNPYNSNHKLDHAFSWENQTNLRAIAMPHNFIDRPLLSNTASLDG